MQIKSLHIVSFGGLRNRDIDLDEGVNVIEGANEAGKTSAAMFIKFIFYGLSSKGLKAEGASERARFINRETSQAAGYIMAEASDGTLYRLERVLIASDGTTPRERIRIINQKTGETVTGQNPGEYFFGVPEDVFVGTAFVSQNRPVKPDVSGEGVSKGSVENLLTSADENVDIKRAVKKLDAVRRELCHKKGAGGEISELCEKRSSLAAERDRTAGRAAEILSVSSSVNDIKTRISELRESQDRQARIFSALDKIELKHRFESLDAAAEQIADLTNSVRMIDESPVGGSFEDELLAAERDVRAYAEEDAAYREKLPQYPEEDDDIVIPDGDAAVSEVRRNEKTARALFGVSIALLICGIAALAAAVVMYLIGADRFLLPAGIAVILALTGIAFLIVRGRYTEKLRTLLGEWGAESTDEIDDAVADTIESMRRTQALINEKRELTESLGKARAKGECAKEKIAALASKVHLSAGADLGETIKALRQIAASAREERSTLLKKTDVLRGRLEVLAEQLDGTDRAAAIYDADAALATEDGQTAASLTPDGVKSLEKEKEFTDTALKAAVKRKESLDERLAELGKLSRTPDEIETMISSLDERIEELSLRRDACELAQEAIRRAGESMRSGVIPRISGNASRIIADCTEKYTRLTVDSAFACGLGDGDDVKTSEFFSRGTGDLAYIALRIALAEEVFRAERPTLIFDESFAHVDSGRLKNVLRMLSTGDGQHLVFTCRSEEAEAARALDCSVIKL